MLSTVSEGDLVTESGKNLENTRIEGFITIGQRLASYKKEVQGLTPADLDLRHLSSGIYEVRVEGVNVISTWKIILQ